MELSMSDWPQKADDQKPSQSAPATPCNVTPTTFYQHKSSPANTLPADIRKNISSSYVGLPSSPEALAFVTNSLAQEPLNKELFGTLVDAALRTTFLAEFEVKYNILKSLEQDKKPSIVISVLGQELLAQGHETHALTILESALRMGIDNIKLRGSVLSTISYGYCILKDYEKAILYMQKELLVESELEDVAGQCRVLSNLGYTYYKLRKYEESLEAHRRQLDLAMRNHLYERASMGLNAIGHVHVARNDFVRALTSHSRCLDLLKLLGDPDFNQFKELLSIGYIHVMLGEYEAAGEKYKEGQSLLKYSDKLTQEEFATGHIMVNFNLAYLALKKHSFDEAKQHYAKVIELAEEIPGPSRCLHGICTRSGLPSVQ